MIRWGRHDSGITKSKCGRWTIVRHCDDSGTTYILADHKEKENYYGLSGWGAAKRKANEIEGVLDEVYG